MRRFIRHDTGLAQLTLGLNSRQTNCGTAIPGECEFVHEFAAMAGETLARARG